MKPRVSNQKTAAMTLTEVLAVIVVLFVLAVIFLNDGNGPVSKQAAQRINCINNLKQIGLSYRVWEGDHGDKYPMQTSVTNGGTMELANGMNAWINYSVMSNELSTPKVCICPADTGKIAATNFTTDFNNSKISYFVNLDADDAYPQMFLSGDDNFAVGGVPVKSGLLEFSTNAPVTWTAERHKNTGYIALSDGSVATVNNSMLTDWFHQIGSFTNRIAIP